MISTISIRFALLSLLASSALADSTTRKLTECDTLKGCYLRDLTSGTEVALTGNDSYKVESSSTAKYSIRCDVNGLKGAESNYMHFFYDGKNQTEFNEPRWMYGDSSENGWVNPVDYLSTCGSKTLKIEGWVWSNICFAKEYKLTAQCPPTAAPVVAPTAPVVAPTAPVAAPVAPTMAPKAPTNAPKAPTNAPKAPTSAPKAPTSAPKAPTNAPKAPTNAPKAPTNAPKAPTNAPKAPTNAPRTPTGAPKAPVSPPVSPPVTAPVPAPKAADSPVVAPVPAPVAVPVAAPAASPSAPVAKPICKAGYKLVSGYCVIQSCMKDYQCPENMVRLPNRKCYNNNDDCGCAKGYTKKMAGKLRSQKCPCRKTIRCDYGMTWLGNCKSAPK